MLRLEEVHSYQEKKLSRITNNHQRFFTEVPSRYCTKRQQIFFFERVLYLHSLLYPHFEQLWHFFIYGNRRFQRVLGQKRWHMHLLIKKSWLHLIPVKSTSAIVTSRLLCYAFFTGPYVICVKNICHASSTLAVVEDTPNHIRCRNCPITMTVTPFSRHNSSAREMIAAIYLIIYRIIWIELRACGVSVVAFPLTWHNLWP